MLTIVGCYRLIHSDFALWANHLNHFNDYQPLYLGTKVWAHGDNPYSPAEVLRQLKTTNPIAYSEGTKDLNTQLVLYPPSALPIEWPGASIPWRSAYWLQVGLSLTIYIAMLWTLSRVISENWASRRKFFVAFGFAMAPFHYGLGAPNISIIVASVICIAMITITKRPITGGILLGLCVATKPQLGILFLLHLLLTRQRRPFVAAVCIASLLLSISIGWMAIHHTHWIDSYNSNLHTLVSPDKDGPNGIVRNGISNFALINLQPLIYALTGSMMLSNTLAFAIFALLMGGYTKTLLSKLSQVGVTRFTHLALLSVMTLIPVYQRYYNSILLLLVLMWALVIPQRLIATVTVIGMSSFLYEFAFTQHPSLQLSAKPSANWFILAAGPMLLMYLYRFKASGQPDPIRKAMEKLP